MWINVCASIVGCRSSVEHEDLCTDMLLKAYWRQFPPFWPRPTKIFYGVSERHHVIYWIYLCDVFRMCFCYLLDRKLFLYSYDIVKLLCILYFTPFTTLVNSWQDVFTDYRRIAYIIIYLQSSVVNVYVRLHRRKRSPKTPTSLIRYTIYSKPKRLSQIFKWLRVNLIMKFAEARI